MSLETTLFLGLLVVVLAVALAAAVVLLAARRRAAGPDQGLALLQQEMDALRREMAIHLENQSHRLETAHATVGDGLDRASRTVAAVSQQLGRLEQATQRVLEVGQSVAGIEDLLRAPKLRGVMGELLLAEILKQSIPEALFELQYPLRSGERVDAVIRVGDALLPVDAKFPLENLRRSLAAEGEVESESYRRAFVRDFRRRVDEVASKYVVPDQGTLPLAFLYVPAENVYQQAVLADRELADYAVARRVIPVGPLGFYAFLQTVLLGSRAMGVAGHVREILAGLDQAAIDIGELRQELDKMTRHVDHTRSSLEEVAKRVGRLGETLRKARLSAVESPPSRPT